MEAVWLIAAVAGAFAILFATIPLAFLPGAIWRNIVIGAGINACVWFGYLAGRVTP